MSPEAPALQTGSLLLSHWGEGGGGFGILQAGQPWSGLSFPSPGHLPNPGIEPGSLALQVDSLLSEPPGKPNRLFRNTK